MACNCEWAYQDQAGGGIVFYCLKCKRKMGLADMKQMVGNYATMRVRFAEMSQQLTQATTALAEALAQSEAQPAPAPEPEPAPEAEAPEKPKRVRRKKVEEVEPEAVA